MATKSVFILSKNKKYNYKNFDESANISIRNCVAYFRKSAEDGTVHQVAYHAHPIYEMHFVMEGECEFETSSGKKYLISKNQIIIIPYQKRHRITYESDIFSKMITEFEINLNPENESDFYRVFEQKILDVGVYDVTDEIVYIVQELIKNSTEKRNEYKSLVYAYLYAYLTETARLIVGNTEIRRKSEYGDPRVAEAVDYIKANITNNISSGDIAEKCFISTRQLVRIFLKNLGTTPSEYIRKCKVDYARRLLLETDIQISEIAEQLGFAEVTAFINFFRRYEGITPAKFRKKSR